MITREHGISVVFDEIPSLPGVEVTSPYITLEARHRKLFEEATLVSELGDAADSDQYPDGLLEGFHLLGLIDYFVATCIDIDRDTVYGWNYGLDRVRFVSPMRSDVPLRFRATVSKVEAKGDGYLIHIDCVLEHEGAQRPGMVAHWIAYHLPIEDRP